MILEKATNKLNEVKGKSGVIIQNKLKYLLFLQKMIKDILFFWIKMKIRPQILK